jgi:hypothetical protein
MRVIGNGGCEAVPLIGDATRVCVGGVPYRDTPTSSVYCMPCPRGRVAVGNVCELCPEGTFATFEGCEGKTARSCELVDMGPLSDDVCGSAPERRLVALAGLRLVEMGPDALW